MVASAVSTANAVSSSRFQTLDQNGTDKILEDADSQRTKQTTKWAEAVFNGTYALSSVCKFMFPFYVSLQFVVCVILTLFGQQFSQTACM